MAKARWLVRAQFVCALLMAAGQRLIRWCWSHPARVLHPARRIEHARVGRRAKRKPAWVLRQLVLLQAHLPHAGCRLIALTFNRVFAHREVTVSKSYVHRVLRQNAHAVAEARKAIRQATPRPVALNHCWGLDMTGRCDERGQLHTVLGIVDHGSRLAVRIARLPRKCSWTLLGHLCLAIAQFGKPRCIRTDNEACFTGRVFTRGLRILGIGHQRSDLHCPWQNGRIERLFGTLKGVLKQLSLGNGFALDALLRDFSTWYNELRPHQSLGGMTPSDAWNGVDPFHAPQPPKEVRFVEGWAGLMAGFRIRRR
ncbi:MAG: integrase core domain-containing protein [Hydrogenophaga sp.]|uniref:integrase core domain-containing protein n=1 Tax=Hydrogenophaga sp. TaxID=1904254 RepID=UPI002ABBDA8A|nr:integrase core domain-containing protein [Hydrogenophaga sp.]MDZ4282435.1 integrase core domain-containing protein [Hydrogenophaga sp.]